MTDSWSNEDRVRDRMDLVECKGDDEYERWYQERLRREQEQADATMRELFGVE